jgi:peptidoglycan/xylan/chitin deacetylase (PgdA/CDA1 family)
MFPMMSSAQSLQADEVVNPGFEVAGDTNARAYDWQDFGEGYSRVGYPHTGMYSIRLRKTSSDGYAGAYQRVELNQTELKPVFIGGWARGLGVTNTTDSFLGASIYAEIVLQDGTVVYWNSIRNEGSFPWRWIGFNTGTLPLVNQPISHIFVIPVLHGSTGTVYFDDIAVTEHDPSAGAVTVMIDDGETNTYTDAKPILDGADIDASMAIISRDVGTGGYMSWAQIDELVKSGWDIVSHGRTHTDFTALSTARLRYELYGSQRDFARRGYTVRHLAVPFGAYNGKVLGEAARYYDSARLYEQNTNPNGLYPYDVKVRGVLENTSDAELQTWLSEARAKGSWQIITFHTIAETGPDAYHISAERFKEMIGQIKASGLEVLTYTEGIERFGTKQP